MNTWVGDPRTGEQAGASAPLAESFFSGGPRPSGRSCAQRHAPSLPPSSLISFGWKRDL